MSKPSDTTRSLLHRLGVAGPRSRAFQGSGARISALLTIVAAVAAFGAAPAFAGKQYISGISFGAKGVGAGQLEDPEGIAVDNDPASPSYEDVYVADTGNRRIDVFTSSGTFVMAFGKEVGSLGEDTCTVTCKAGASGSSPGEFETPRFIAVDQSTGDVYVEDTGDNLITKFSESGALIKSWGTEGQMKETTGGALFSGLRGVAVGPAGELLVLESGAVAKFSDTGVFGETFPVGGTVKPGLAVDSSGGVYVTGSSDDFAEKYESGMLISQFSHVPSALAVNPATNNVLVFQSEFSNGGQFGNDIQLFPPFAEPTAPIETFTAKGLSGSSGIAVNGGEAYYPVYVTQPATDTVATFDYLQLPEVSSEPVSNVELVEYENVSATLHGNVDPEGLPVTSCEFEYGTSASYGKTAPCEPAAGSIKDTGITAVTAKLKGLLSGTTYHFRLVATNTEDEHYPSIASTHAGSDEAFPTPPTPVVAEPEVRNLTASSAELTATVDPQGLAVRSCTFEYGTSSAYGTIVPCEQKKKQIGHGSEPVLVSAKISGLEPNTEYHWRLVAADVNGSSLRSIGSADHMFVYTTTPFALPDNRAYEMVSPPEKEGALITTSAEGLTEAAADGDAITYKSKIPTQAGVQGFNNNSQDLSTRGASGWQTRDLAVPHEQATSGVVGGGPEYAFFSSDLSGAIVQPLSLFTPCENEQGAPQPCLSPEASEQTAFLEDTQTGVFTPLVTGCPSPAEEADGRPCPQRVAEHANVTPGTVFGGAQEGDLGSECQVGQYCGPYFVAGTPDLSHVLLESDVVLTEGAGAGGGLYEWSAATAKLTFVGNAGGEAGGGSSSQVGAYAAHGAHGISEDGSRVIFHGRSEGLEGLLMRDTVTEETVRLGEGEFQDASADDSRVFFDAGWNGELDVWEQTSPPGEPLAGRVTDLTEGKGMRGLVLGASEDGNYVYFVSEGVLAGSGATGPGNNLYVDHYNGSTWKATFIAALSAGEDYHDWDGGTSEWKGALLEYQPTRVSPNGQWLTFMSQTSLTGYDNREAVSGGRDAEVYLYHAPSEASVGALTCASCDPTGARPVGVENEGRLDDYFRAWREPALVAATLPASYMDREAALQISHQPRYLSNSGRVFFNSYDALVPQDINGTSDVYEYEPEGVGSCTSSGSSGSVVFEPAHAFEVQGVRGESGAGCVGLISSGDSSEESEFVDASESGGDVFFLTASRLAPQDVDTALDIYDAHECTSASPCIPSPVSPPECDTEASCKLPPTPEPTVFAAPPSATFSGPGNLAGGRESNLPAIKKVTKKTAKCNNGYVKKKIKKKETCVKKPKQKKSSAKKSNRHRGAKS